jgi:hypothetical protein
MRLPATAHSAQPWRIHELAFDFRVEDVWQLPTDADRVAFADVVDVFTSGGPESTPSRLSAALWAIRRNLGQVLGWDDPDRGLGVRVASLRQRLPEDLRQTPGPRFESLPFGSLYLLDEEWAAEIANETVHGVLHLGRVLEPSGRHRDQLAILVKPNGLPGEVYMAAIRPFRRLIVYPAIMRRIEQASRSSGADARRPVERPE